MNREERRQLERYDKKKEKQRMNEIAKRIAYAEERNNKAKIEKISSTLTVDEMIELDIIIQKLLQSNKIKN